MKGRERQRKKEEEMGEGREERKEEGENSHLRY